MKKFKFRLEPILKLREHAEKERQKELAAVLHDVNRQDRHLASLVERRRITMRGQRQLLEASISAAGLLIHSRYLLRLKGEDLSGQEILGALKEEVSKKQARLAEASRDKKIYQKLKERQYRQFQDNQSRAERIELDEIAISAFRRSHKPGQ